MENASKALIIAGAILVSILIITLGIMVYQQSKSTVGEANLNSEQVQTFNAKFMSYIGNGVSGTNVNALAQTVVANNATNAQHKITMTYGTTISIGAEGSTTDTVGTVDNTSKFNISQTYDNGGYIKTITVVLSTTE